MDIGFALQQARERMGYSLEEMAEITNIHIKYLHSLEQGQFDQLPSEFYVRIFLKNYAKRVGLDYDPLLDAYDHYLQSKDQQKPSTNTIPDLGFSMEHTKQKASNLEQEQETSPALQTYFEPPLRGMNGSRFPSLLSDELSPEEQSAKLLPSLPKNEIADRNGYTKDESSSIASTKVGAIHAPAYPKLETASSKEHAKDESSSIASTKVGAIHAPAYPTRRTMQERESSSFHVGPSNAPIYPKNVGKIRNASGQTQMNQQPPDEWSKPIQGRLPAPVNFNQNEPNAFQSQYQKKYTNVDPDDNLSNFGESSSEYPIVSEPNRKISTQANRKMVEPIAFQPRSRTHATKKEEEPESIPWLAITVGLSVVAICVTVYFWMV